MNNFKSIFYCKQGLSHLENDTPCQDSVSYYEDDNILVAAVSDGLGSKKNSQYASKTITSALARILPEKISDEFNNFDSRAFNSFIIGMLKDEVSNIARSNNISISTLDATVLFVCINKQEKKAVVFQLGDGAICLIRKDTANLFSKQEVSNIANATYTLFSDAINHSESSLIDLEKNNIYGFILCSDGMQYEIYDKFNVKAKAAEYFNLLTEHELDNAEKALEENINSMVKMIPGIFYDDISIILFANPNFNNKISLPKDTTWLCECGNRNELQNTRCLCCGKDFTKLYQGYDFRKDGGKKSVFERLNQNPFEEKKFLEKFLPSKILESTEVNIKPKDIQKKETNQVNTILYSKANSKDIREHSIIHEVELSKNISGNPEAIIRGSQVPDSQYISHQPKEKKSKKTARKKSRTLIWKIFRYLNNIFNKNHKLSLLLPNLFESNIDDICSKYRDEFIYEKHKIIDTLVGRTIPCNKNITEIYLKLSVVCCSNNLIYDIDPLASKLNSIENLDEKIFEGRYAIINEILDKKKSKDAYALISSYLHEHNPSKFMAYSKITGYILEAYREKDEFAKFNEDDLLVYDKFHDIIQKFLVYYQLENLKYSELNILFKLIWKEVQINKSKNVLSPKQCKRIIPATK